jgi:hypothetical protein
VIECLSSIFEDLGLIPSPEKKRKKKKKKKDRRCGSSENKTKQKNLTGHSGTSIIPALGRLRQRIISLSIRYIVSFRPAWVTQ